MKVLLRIGALAAYACELILPLCIAIKLQDLGDPPLLGMSFKWAKVWITAQYATCALRKKHF